jgi:hypothetical protein
MAFTQTQTHMYTPMLCTYIDLQTRTCTSTHLPHSHASFSVFVNILNFVSVLVLGLPPNEWRRIMFHGYQVFELRRRRKRRLRRRRRRRFISMLNIRMSRTPIDDAGLHKVWEGGVPSLTASLVL